jgi:hypothetical protein
VDEELSLVHGLLKMTSFGLIPNNFDMKVEDDLRNRKRPKGQRMRGVY